MDKRIAELFEYQHFAPNKRMEKIIADTQRRYEALDEEELFLVAAAGVPRDFQDLENDLSSKEKNEFIFTKKDLWT